MGAEASVGAARSWLEVASDERLVAALRRGESEAFDALYDRYSAPLLVLCRRMLRSEPDAEDALQMTFASAYRWLTAESRPVAVRPWLYAVARNTCMSILRARKPVSDLDELPAVEAEDPGRKAEQAETLREMLTGVLELPMRQRAALLLSEVHGFSHKDIGRVLGVEPTQVKSYVFQARTNLISDRDARDADCSAIREELDGATGAALLKGHLRKHLRTCETCREYLATLKDQRARVGTLIALPRRRREEHPRPSAVAGTG
jgi:RNA polymerase sigma factor (sigma-70 family)